jgi:hypothetical protein
MNVEIGTEARYFFSRNICFKFSAFCLCSAGRVVVQAVRLTIEVVGFLLEAVSVPQERLENVEDSMKIYLSV